jgi:putative transposase
MTPEPRSYHRHRFPTEIISHAVWLYHVFSLSLRDVELILAARDVVIPREHPGLVQEVWCQICRASAVGQGIHGIWMRFHLPEWLLHYLWRAVDQHGVEASIARDYSLLAVRLLRLLTIGARNSYCHRIS